MSEFKFDFELALKQFKLRKLENKDKQIDNSKLSAGSPMYFYCRFCGAHTDTKPEIYMSTPKTVCDPCKILHEHGLI